MSIPLTTDTPANGGPSLTPNSSAPEIPPWEQGDRLTREEFERRHDAMPRQTRAELIEGIVRIPTLVRFKYGASPRVDVIGWLGYYHALTPGVCAGASPSVRLDLENELQPDVAMIIEPSLGGKTRISRDDVIEGAPELLVEIVTTVDNLDQEIRRRVYRCNELKEHVVWRVQDKAIDWFALRRGDYERLIPNAAGVYESGVFPGLWLDAAAMIRGDLARVLHVLDDGLRSPAHAAFVERLRQAADRPNS